MKAPSQDVQATRASVRSVDEGLDEAGLADARLAGHEHEPTVVPPGVGGIVVERPELQLPLEQAHQTAAVRRSASAAAS